MGKYFYYIFYNVFQIFLFLHDPTFRTRFIVLIFPNWTWLLTGGLFYFCIFWLYFYTFKRVLQVELILNLDNLVFKINIRCFGKFVLLHLAQIVHNIQTYRFGVFVLNNFQFVLIANQIVLKVELFWFCLNVRILKLVTADNGDFILLYFLH